MKKVISMILITAMMIVSLAGCGSKGTSDTKKEETKGKTETTGNAETSKEVITVSILMHGISQMSGVQNDPVTKAIEEKLGIKMDIISTSGMDVTTELNALIASDDLPDIVVGITPEQRQLLIDSEQIISLDDLVANKGGEITGKKAGQKALDYSKKYYSNDSGQLYFINMRAGEDFNAGFPTVAPYIRWDIYNQIGSPEIKNMDDLLNVLKQMQDAYPETEDGKKVYAISGCLADPSWNTFSLTAAEAFIGFRKLDNYGLSGTMTSNVTEYINAMDTSDSPTWQIFKFFNKAYQMGILDPDSVTMKYDQWAEKIMAGQVLYVPFGWYATTPLMEDENKTFLPVKFESFENDSFTCSYAYSQGGASYAISKNCKSPERAMELLNYAWSYEGAMMFVNGIQGENWDMVDGVAQLLDTYVAGLVEGNVEGPLFTTFFGPYMNEETNTPINLTNSTEYFEKYKRTGVVKEYCDVYGIAAPIENYSSAKYHVWDEAWERGVEAYTGDLKEIDINVQNYVLTNLPKMVLAASNDEFETMRLKFMDDINAMGAQKLYEGRKGNYETTVQEVLNLSK